MASSAVGRSRGLRKQLSSEDQALNMIAKEAEARLAAKRAARAEARSIRMKELERKQKEIDDLENDEFDSSRRKSSSRLSSPGSASSPLGSDSNLNASSDASFLKESLKETEEKYRKAMVNAAQLDNERQALLYQVECLKDVIEDLEESIHNAKDELSDKTKEFNKLSREHEKTNDQLDKCTYLLSERERILDEHGINLDGTLKETDEPDGNTEESTTQEASYPSNHFDTSQETEERQSLLSEIESLRNEIEELKSQQETTGSRKQAEQARMVEQRADFERSFVDVSSEADAIRDDARHVGLYVNNNEKCDDFEVIDDGSQQGGIQNFEDKSFERSGRSSMLSSIRTDLVTDSVESEVPLEISVDTSHCNKQQDDYDIVQINEPRPSGGTALDINALAGGFRAASPAPVSNINVNKYLFSDNDEEDEELETTGTFNIDMYFATEEKVSFDNGEEEYQGKDLTNENEGLESQDTSPELVSEEDTAETTVEEEQVLDTSSPFLEVKSQSNSNNNDTVLEPAEGPEIFTQGERDELEGNNDEMNDAFVSSDEIQNDSTTIVGEINEETQQNSSNTDSLAVRADVDMRKSVEDLYDKILSEEDNVHGQSSEGLPPDASFGEPISISTRIDDTKEKGGLDSTTKKEGWLVRVESFSTPSSCTPQIKVIVDAGIENEDVDERNKDFEESSPPVPKERRKKKKKKNKKQKSVDVVENSGDEKDESEVTKQDSLTNSPSLSPTKSLDHSDIPKQFLDASNTFGRDSLSDTSDLEQEVTEDGTTINKKRGNSKKKNKESCKTQ